MMKVLATTLGVIFLSILGAFGVQTENQKKIAEQDTKISLLNETIHNQEQKFGAFTQLNSTDKLTTFPTTYNANLNKTIETGTTSVASITTLSNLSSIGTITTGTWNGTAIGVAYQGTGTTSPTANQLILGNGSSGFKVVNGFGASGQFLQSQGAGAAPLWQTSAIDQAANYTWTGNHTFASSTVLQNFQTQNLTATGTVKFNQTAYAFPPNNTNASSTVLANNGANGLFWVPQDFTLLAATTTTAAQATSTITIPARQHIRIVIAAAGFSAAGTVYLKFNNDSTTNYSWRYSNDGGADVTSGASATSASWCDPGTGADTNPKTMIWDITNLSAVKKFALGSGMIGLNNAPDRSTAVCQWANTSAQITSVQIVTQNTTSMSSGSVIIVYGSNY